MSSSQDRVGASDFTSKNLSVQLGDDFGLLQNILYPTEGHCCRP